MRFQGLLTRSVRGMWITSYSFGLRLFDQYVLRSVSQSPLNAVVLADQGKLAEVWSNLPEGDEYLAKNAGSRYLLRGVRSVGGGAFHPKTYLFARADGATLVVGSGNLTRDGIDHGHEVFTSFESTREVDLPSMRSWAGWMSRLVENEDDDVLRERWAALRESNPWMLGPSEGSSFLANDQEPLIDQLAGRLRDSVAELHLTAPFFDRDAKALSKLIRRYQPDRLCLYVGAGVKVHGPSLADVLAEVGDVRVSRYEPHNFVHAKLIGAIEPGGRGILLIGSPNLSSAALLGVCTEPGGGNWEAAVLREGSAEQVRAVFEGNDKLTLVELSLENLESFEFEDDDKPPTGLLTLRSASWRSDGRIATECATTTELPADAVMSWAGGSRSATLDGEGVTVESLEESGPPPFLVWLAKPDGTVLTNKVPVDDPAALRDTLLGSRQTKDSRPTELQGLEDAPLIRIALWANDKFIFDPDKTSAFRRAQEAIEGPQTEDAGNFWERYAKEELQYDPRSQSYRPLTPGAGDGGPVDELLRELQAMLHAAPGELGPTLRIVRGMASGEEDAEIVAGTPWSMEARQRRRAYNLFMRWCQAVGDTRHMLISPSAPVVNYKTLVGVVFAAWMHEALERKQLQKLLLTLLTAFVGLGGEQPGFLGRIEDEQRADALQRLDPFVIELAAGLAAVAMESGWRSSIYDWQPVLRRGLELDVLLPGEWSVRVVERLAGRHLSVEEIYELLQERIHYVDDETWCDRVAEELGFEDVSFDLNRAAKVRSWVFVKGAGDPLADTRLLSIARRFLDFKKAPAVAVKTDRGDVMIFEPGKQARALLDDVSTRSPKPVTVARLREIEDQGGSWADLLDAAAAAA